MKIIFRLSELPENTRKGFIKLRESNFKIPNKEFDQNGLKFPITYLNQIKGAIIFLPLEFMAEYVDAVTQTNIDSNNNYFMNKCLINFHSPSEGWENINTTSIGNTAYMALYGNNKELRDKSFAWLEAFYSYYITKPENLILMKYLPPYKKDNV